MLFYTVIGAHHFIFSPIPHWLQTTAILFSVGMMVPVWAGTGNFLLTLRGTRHAVHQSYALPFLLVGILGYGLGSTQGTFEAFRAANIYLHFTNFTVGHSHATMYGFIAFIIWGAAYGLVPQFTGREPKPTIVGVHFWLALVGVVIYVIALSVAGVLQGITWVAGRSFIASIVAADAAMVVADGRRPAHGGELRDLCSQRVGDASGLSEQVSAIPIQSTRHAL